MIGNKAQIAYGIILSYGTTLFYIVAGLIYTPFLIHELGLSDYGLYTLVMSVVTSLSVDFGIGKAQARFIARYLSEGKGYMVGNLLGITARLYLMLDVVLLLILGLVNIYADSIFANLSSFEIERFKVILLITTVFVVFSFPLLSVGGIFVAYEKIVQLKIIELCYKLTSILSLVTTLLLGGGLYVIVAVFVLCDLLFQLIKLFYLYYRMHLRINIKYKDKILLRKIGSFSLWTTVSMIATSLFIPLIPTLLAIVANTNEISLFAIVATVITSITMITTSMNSVFLPMVTRLVVRKSNNEEYTGLMTSVGRINLYIIGFLVVALICFGKEFFLFWLGAGFEKSYYALMIVLFPFLFHPTQNIANELCYVNDKVKYIAIVRCKGSLICLLLTIWLGKYWGVLGAAIALSVSYVIAYNLLANFYYYRLFHLNIVKFLYNCQVKIFPSFIVTVLFGELFNFMIPSNIGNFIWKTVLLLLIYIASIYSLAFNKQEKTLVLSVIAKYRRK